MTEDKTVIMAATDKIKQVHVSFEEEITDLHFSKSPSLVY